MRTRTRSRFKDDTLVVGIDVAKRKHVAVAEHDGRLTKALRFNNEVAGFEALVAWVEQVKVSFGAEQVVVGLEATGVYGRALEQWLLARGYLLHRVPPLLTHRAKEMLDRSPTKSDPKDAGVIADLVRQGKGDRFELPTEIFEGLRVLGELRHRLGVVRAAALNRLHRVIDQVFPELPGLFDDLGQPTCLALLRTAPTPAAVLDMGLAALSALLKKASHGKLSRDRASAIMAAAGRSVGVSRALNSYTLEVDMLLDELATIQANIARAEAEQAVLLRDVPYADRLAAIPGMSTATVASLLGETGDIRRFRHARQLLKLAGLNLTERSSGERKGKMGISKRGRPRLRHVLYLAALRMSSKDGNLGEFHHRLRKTKPGTVSVTAGMRKLLRATFAMVRDGTAFEPAKLKARPALHAA